MTKLILTLVMALFTCSSTYAKKYSKELRTEKNGFTWYLLTSKDGNWEGVADKYEKIIIPLKKYNMIRFRCVENKGYFIVSKYGRNGLNEGLCDFNGVEKLSCIYSLIYYDKINRLFMTEKNDDGNVKRTNLRISKSGRIIRLDPAMIKEEKEDDRIQETNNNTKDHDLSIDNSNLLYKGIYTISSQGRSLNTGGYTGYAGSDFECEIEIYDNYIKIGNEIIKFKKISKGERVYIGKAWGIEPNLTYDTFFVDENYNIRKESTLTNQFGIDTFEYEVIKGNGSIQKHEPKYSNNKTTGNSTNNSPNKKNKDIQNKSKIACSSCKYTNGKCPVCKGAKRVSNKTYGVNSTKTCNNCNGTGRCPSCGGDGWIN